MDPLKRKPTSLPSSSGAQKRMKPSSSSSMSSYQKSTLQRGVHPLGVQPLGNLYLSPTLLNQRDIGLGLLGYLSDEMIQELLSRLSASDLVVLSQVSKALYVFCHHEDLWKDLSIEKFGGDFWFAGTWKETYAAKMMEGKHKQQIAHVEDKTGNDDAHVVKKKIKVEGFYSDYLFQSWYCSSRQIAPEWLKGDNIDRRSGLSMSVEDFIREYEEPNIPVVITDVVTTWPAYHLWTKEYLKEKFGGVTFKAESVDITMERYLRYAELTTDEAPIYLFDRLFCERMPGAGEQFEVPEYFREDLFSVLKTERPDYRWLIIGPARSGSTFHKDPNSTSAWNAVITGSKKWILYPPHVVPPGVFPSKDGAEVTTSISLMEWFINFYPHTQVEETPRHGGKAGKPSAETIRPIECIVNAGEMMFIPNGWWHTVLNVDDSIAITQNYVSGRNLKNVLHFVKDCGEQVSGYHGKGPLYDKFVASLEKEEKCLPLLKKISEDHEAEATRRLEAALQHKVGLWETLKSKKEQEGAEKEGEEAPQPFTFGFGDDVDDE